MVEKAMIVYFFLYVINEMLMFVCDFQCLEFSYWLTKNLNMLIFKYFLVGINSWNLTIFAVLGSKGQILKISFEDILFISNW